LLETGWEQPERLENPVSSGDFPNHAEVTMPALDVRPAEPADLHACAELLAARHRRDMARLAHLDPALATADGARPLLEALLANPRARGMVAELDGKVAGFLFGERMLLPPADFASQYVPPQSISIPVEGHAAAAGVPVFEAYRDLYAALASAWVAEGYFVHRASIPAGDPEMQDAWVALGFGRQTTAATRPTAPTVIVPKPRALTIERASPEDIDDVMRLADDLAEWHWRSPIFWPFLAAPQPAAKEFNHNALRSSETPFFVAYEEGRAVGMQTFLRPGFTPPIVDRDHDVYLYEGVVAHDARGGGIGATLLKHSLEWAVRNGFASCTLHFAPANPSGAPFWLSHGFVPVEHTMERTIDSRVAWARPTLTVSH
jgi:GNAT superfamily N-acetyltransferase